MTAPLLRLGLVGASDAHAALLARLSSSGLTMVDDADPDADPDAVLALGPAPAGLEDAAGRVVTELSGRVPQPVG